MYSDKVKDYFIHPRNQGEIKNADGFGQSGNMKCGDEMKVWIKVTDNKISEIKFQSFGCAASIATASMGTELVLGRSLEDAEKLSNDEIAEALDGLPPIKMHCSVLAANCIKAAIADYREKCKIKK